MSNLRVRKIVPIDDALNVKCFLLSTLNTAIELESDKR